MRSLCHTSSINNDKNVKRSRINWNILSGNEKTEKVYLLTENKHCVVIGSNTYDIVHDNWKLAATYSSPIARVNSKVSTE